MGDKNVIALLTSINGNLKKIVDDSQKNKTATPEETTEKMAQSLNTGSVLTGDAIKPKAEQAKVGDVVIPAASLASLKTLPVIVLAFAKLKPKDIQMFTDTLEALGKSFENFSKVQNIDKSSKMLESVSTCMKTLDNMHFVKLAMSLKVANALKLQENLIGMITGLSKAVSKAGKMSDADVKKLETATKSIEAINGLAKGLGIVVVSVAALAIAIKTIGAGEILKATAISLGIMTALGLLAVGIGALAKKTKGSARELKDVTSMIFKMQALVLTTALIGFVAEAAMPMIIKGFAATAGIILGYTLIAALASGLGTFMKANTMLMNAVPKMAMWGMALTLGTLLVGMVAQQAWPAILLGFAAISGIILGYTLIAVLVSAVGKLSKTFDRDIRSIIFMAGCAMGLTLGTLLIGYVTKMAWKEILYGFAATSAIILGYAEVAALASGIAKGVSKSRKDFITIAAVVAGAELLVLGAIGIAKLLETSSPGAIAASISGIGGMILAISYVAKLAQKHTKSLKNAPVNLAVAAGAILASEMLVLAAVGIGKLVKSEKDVYASVGVLSASGLVLGGLIMLLKVLDKNKRNLTTGGKNLLMAAAAVAAAEGLILGAVLISKLANKEDILPAAGVLMASYAVVGAMVCFLELIKDHEKDIRQGAKSMLMVAGVMLAAEGIILGAILIGKLFKDDPGLMVAAAGVLTAAGGLVFGLVGLLKSIEKHNKDLKKGAKSLLLVSATMLAAEVIILGAAGLAMLFKSNPGLEGHTLMVLALAGSITLGLVGVVKLVDKHNKDLKNASKSLLRVALVAAAAEGLILGAIVLAKIKEAAGVGDGEILAIVGTASALVTAFAGLAIVAGKFDKEVKKGITSLAKIELLALGAEALILGVIGLIAAKNAVGGGWDDVFLTVGAMATVVTAFGALATVAGLVKSVITKGIPAMALVELLALGAEALVFGIVKICEAKNKAKVDWSDVFITLGAMAAVVTSFAVLAGIVGIPPVLAVISAGTAGLGLVTLLAFGAVALVGSMVAMVAAKNKLLGANSGWDPIFEMLGAMVTVVGTFELFAAASALAMPFILLGTPAVLAATLLAAAATGMMFGIVGLVATAKAAEISWDDVNKAIDNMTTVVGRFELLAACAGLAAPFILLGTPAMLTVQGLALAATALMFAIVGLVDTAKSLDVSWEETNSAIDSMTTVVGKFELLAGVSALAMPFVLAGTPAVLAAEALAAAATLMMTGIVSLVAYTKESGVTWDDTMSALESMKDVIVEFEVLAGIASLASPFIVVGTAALLPVIEIADRSIEVLNKIVGVAAAVKELGDDGWTQIDNALSAMSKIISNSGETPGFEELSKKAARSIISIRLGAPALKEVASTAKLTASAMTELCTAAVAYKELTVSDVTRVIDAFGSLTNSLDDMVGLKFLLKARTISSAKSQIGVISEVTLLVASTLAGISDVAGKDGKIRSARLDKNGRMVYGKWVDAGASAETIANSLGLYVETLGESFGKLTKESIEVIKAGMEMMGHIMSPISVFAETLSGFEGKDGFIRVIKYDENGKQIDTPFVDLKMVANTIANSIGTFCGALFSAENAQIWDNMVHGGGELKSVKNEDGSYSTEFTPSTAEKAMGVFATVVNPIGQFVNVLTIFEKSDENGNLVMPLFDKEGNITGTRTVDVVKIAGAIGGAVTTFINHLAQESKDWMNIYNSYEKTTTVCTSDGFFTDEYEYHRSNAFEDAMGLFSKVITPVVAFANMLAQFEAGDGNTLITYDSEGKKRKVNVAVIATTIGSAVTTLVTDMGVAFEKQSGKLKSISENQEAIVELMNSMSTSIGSIGDIDSKGANTVIETYSALLTKIIGLATSGESEKIHQVTVLLNETSAVLTQINSDISEIGGTSNKTKISNINELFDKMNESLVNLNTNTASIDKLKESIDNLGSSDSGEDSVRKLSSTVTSLYEVLMDPKFNEPSPVSGAIDRMLKSVSAAIIGVGAKAEIRRAGGMIGMTNSLSKSFGSVRSSLQQLDNTLDKGNSKRVKNIKAIADAIKAVNNEAANASSNLKNVRDILTSLASLSSKSGEEQLQKVVDKLKNISVGSSGGGGGGGGTSKGTISTAIQEALDGTTLIIPKIEIKGSTKSSDNSYSINKISCRIDTESNSYKDDIPND